MTLRGPRITPSPRLAQAGVNYLLVLRMRRRHHRATPPVHAQAMLILDALHRANTHQEIGFLLTCYVDGLQFYDIVKRLPAGLFASPVQGLDDISARAASLRDAQARDDAQAFGEHERAMLDEIAAVFAAAASRLQVLTSGAPASATIGTRAAAL